MAARRPLKDHPLNGVRPGSIRGHGSPKAKELAKASKAEKEKEARATTEGGASQHRLNQEPAGIADLLTI